MKTITMTDGNDGDDQKCWKNVLMLIEVNISFIGMLIRSLDYWNLMLKYSYEQMYKIFLKLFLQWQNYFFIC